ncbi:MAG: cytochrome c [Acidobacteria bacterium]|nr:cytochrome c [Acidobacteriota bacterium]
MRWTGFILLSMVSLAGCKTGGGPSNFENAVAKQVKQKITVGGRDWKNPVEPNEENAGIGAEHFQHHCMVCHGLDGHSTGVPFAAKMDPPVPDLSSRNVQDYTDGQLKWIIQNGIAPSGMPGWEGILDDNEMWQIVAYIRHLPVQGSLGIPGVYQESAAEHEEAEAKQKPKGHSKSRRKAPHTHTHTHTQ